MTAHKRHARSRPRRRHGLIRALTARVLRKLSAEQRLARLWQARALHDKIGIGAPYNNEARQAIGFHAEPA